MQDQPSAIVIGTGIGGTVAAMLLARAGLRVQLLEKNRTLGGACAGYEKRGFSVDIGTHMFARGAAGPLGEALRRGGRPDAVRFLRVPDIAELRMPGERPVRIPVPSTKRRMPLFLARVARAANLGPKQLIEAGRLFTYLLAMSDDDVDTWNDKTVETLVGRFTTEPAVIGLFGLLLGLYFVLPYWQVSAGEAIWCFRRMVRDNSLSYPEGGARAIPKAYCEIAEAHGAQIMIDSPVRRVLVEGGQTTGVELRDGTRLAAELVICTSSAKALVDTLVEPGALPADYVRRVRDLKASWIAVQAKIGLSRKLVDAGCIVGGASASGRNLLTLDAADMRQMFGQLEAGRIPDVMPFYCPVPSNFDPKLAPDGCQLLTACGVAPTTDIDLADPPEAWEKALLDSVRATIPGLDEHTLFVDTFSTAFIERWIGKPAGPAISTAQIPGQVAGDRLPNATPIRGLYLAGCGAGARGIGTELAAQSAMDCVDEALARLAIRPPWQAPKPTILPAVVAQALRPLAWAVAPRSVE